MKTVEQIHSSIKRPLLGGHVSVAGGFINAFSNGETIGAEVVQFFGASPRQWKAPQPSKEAMIRYYDARKKSSIKSVILHAAYLPNLASSDSSTHAKSVQSISEHLNIATLLEAEGLVFHMGSSENHTDGIKRTVQAIQHIVKAVPGNTFLIMENSAGGGTKLCYDCDELGEIFHAVNSPRLKICIDTAHIFASGILPHFSRETIRYTFDRWDKAFGLENVAVMHINDSKSQAGSHIDRHQNIGDGYIGIAGFQELAKEKRIYSARWVLEVPGLNDTGPDKANIDRLKNLFL